MTLRLPDAILNQSNVRRVLGALTAGGYRALFVGGTVRNALLDKPVSDIDIATDALPERVLDLAQTAQIRAVPTGLAHGTVTLVADGQPFEVTTFRSDVETFGRHATVAFSEDLVEDARRRDFTMNALYAEPDGTVIDPLGGLADLQARRVRFVGDPHDRIREDFLRILRFFRFSAWYADPSEGLEPEGLAACAELADGLAQLSVERIWSELKKILAAPEPGWVLGAMAQSGILARCLPGTTAAALGLLFQAEEQMRLPPEPLRRLVALGGEVPEAGLRLSRAEVRRLDALRRGVGSTDSPVALGHELGQATARDVVALRFALLQSPFSIETLNQIDHGAAAEFPLRAPDLPIDLQGPAIGLALARLKTEWLAEDCLPGKDELLDRL